MEKTRPRSRISDDREKFVIVIELNDNAIEFDGLRAAPARRTGTGNKGAKGFVKPLSTIYSKAYEDYRAYGGDVIFDAIVFRRQRAEQHWICVTLSGSDKRSGAIKDTEAITDREENIYGCKQ